MATKTKPAPSAGRRSLWATLKYVVGVESRVYAFSVAANAILAFFPFIIVLLTIVRHVLHSKGMNDAVLQLLRDYIPAGQEFMIRSINVLVNARKRVQFVSLGALLITSSGVFMPLEVALNRIWGFPRQRPYWKNQLIALGLSFVCGVLALLSVAFSAGQVTVVQTLLGNGAMAREVSAVVTRLAGMVASIAIFFLIYWVLPHGKVAIQTVLPAAVVVGLVWEIAKYLYIVALPHLNFQEVYGPFALAVTMIMWAFFSGLLLLAGAHLSVGERAQK